MGSGISWKRWELLFIVVYAVAFYAVVIIRSLQLSSDHLGSLRGLRSGWISNRYNDLSDAQWRNFRGNLPVLTSVFGLFTLLANSLRSWSGLTRRGMSVVWLSFSLVYLMHLHGACVIFPLSIASANFLLAKIFGKARLFPLMLWVFNLSVLICNRIYEGYSFSLFGNSFSFLDNYRGVFRWHICFNFVVLRMISFGYDYHQAYKDSCPKKERYVDIEKFSYSTYLCYLTFAPLYIAGPIVNYNAFTSQLDLPQRSTTVGHIAWYGIRWVLSFFLMELMTHLFYYNAFAISGLWKYFSPLEVFIIGYGVLLFMWLKFFLIWRYFRFWSLIAGVEAPENMPRCINNCHNLETFWKNWHASFNKWLVRYLYIPLGGSQRKIFNVWFIFTFVAIWHDLEWRLLSWAWLTCIFFVPELIIKSTFSAFQAGSAIGEFFLRELSAVAGAVTITCLMVANLVGFVVGVGGVNLFVSKLLHKDGLNTLGGILLTFYMGTKLMFHIQDARRK